ACAVSCVTVRWHWGPRYMDWLTRVSADVMFPASSYSMKVTPHTSVALWNLNVMLAAAALPTKTKVTAQLVACVQAAASSAGAAFRRRSRGMGRTGQRTVRPLFCDALYWRSGALLDEPVPWSLPHPNSNTALSATSPASLRFGRRVTIGLRSPVG